MGHRCTTPELAGKQRVVWGGRRVCWLCVPKAQPAPCDPGHLSHLPGCSGAPGTLQCQPEQVLPPLAYVQSSLQSGRSIQAPGRPHRQMETGHPGFHFSRSAGLSASYCLRRVCFGNFQVKGNRLGLLVCRLVTFLKYTSNIYIHSEKNQKKTD